MSEEIKLDPIGNAGTADEPFVIAYMCRVDYELEFTGTICKLYPSVEAHRAGCPCSKHGTVEVAVHFRRYIQNMET